MKAYLVSITTATALAIGFGGGLALSGLVAEAAVSRPITENEGATLDAASQAQLEAIVDSQICPKQDTKFGLVGANKCKAADHLQVVRFAVHRGMAAPLDGGGNPTGPPVPFRTIGASSSLKYATTVTFGPPQ